MKKYLQTLIVLLFASFIHSGTSFSSSESLAVPAIIEIINKFSEKSINFDFIIYRCELDYLVDKIANSVNKVTNVIQFRKSPKSFNVSRSAIVFVDHRDLKKFESRAFLSNEYPQDFYFFIYIVNFNGVLKQATFQRVIDPNLLHRFSSYLINHEHSIELVTYTTFQQPNCREVNKVTINRFSKVSKKWESDEFTMEKFRNFNECEFVFLRTVPGGSFYEPIHEIIQSSLNFTTKFVIYDFKLEKYLTEELPTDFPFDLDIWRMVLRENNELQRKFIITHHIVEV
jgi:hypothetical protein